ncbi:Protein TOC75-3 chloroplastic [Zea mays]|uniref:Protein TOC75-3 chloroplastic n=1 Tax=Zea mays TaxID=4577 RepID=A0A1D6JXV4_MAIZE|nr:Protein TOC75-3 chloroplastic [Zea mays]
MALASQGITLRSPPAGSGGHSGRRSSSVPAAAAPRGWGQPHAGQALSISPARYEPAARPPWRGSLAAAIRAAASAGAHHGSDPVPAEPRIELPAIFTVFSEAAKTGAAFFIASSSAAFLLGSFGGFGGGAGGLFGGGGGGGGWGAGGGGAGGGGGGDFWSWLFSAGAANADDKSSGDWDAHGLPVNMTVPLTKLSGLKRYKLSELKFFDRAAAGGGAYTGPEDSFFEMVTLQPGGVYTKSQLLKELETLVSCGMFERVDLEVKPKPDNTIGLTVSFVESVWSAAKQFKCINVGLMSQSGQVDFDQDMTEREKMDYLRKQERDYQQRVRGAKPCILPENVRGEVLGMMKKQEKVSARMLQKIRDHVQKWYHNEGFVCAQVVNFGNLNTNEVVCEVVEGDITKVEYQFQDKLGNIVEGNTQLQIIDRELPQQLRPGHIFNIGAGKQALKNINSLALFSNIEVNPRPDETKEGGIVVEIKLKELEPKSAEVSTEWSIVPGREGRPTLASIQPGGTVSFEHRNIYGLNRSIVGSVTSSNLLNPQDDLSFKLEYVHPYLDGVDDRSKNRTFKTSCFNTRKLSPVFVAGPNMDEAPPVWIDRVGFKANITESFTRQSKFTYGLVVEEITTRDETNTICTHGSRAMPSGGLSMDGPPTTLSGTGVDRMAFLQANITRDNTEFVNGAIVGDRYIFQLDQGLGIGSKNPFFNRHQLTLTKFINLNKQEKGAGKPLPAVLVLHSHYAGCVGDLPSYDAFALGGPYSLATELRVPIRNTHVYAFAEHGTDLGSSKDVKGNPTEFFRRVGHGSSYGVGVKLGLVRGEYIVDHNAGTGTVFFRFGERF